MSFIKKYPKFFFVTVNILAACVFVLLVIFFVLRWLDNYTHHNKFISVPAFQTLTESEADTLARKRGLRVSVIDSSYDERSLPGTILEQYPLNGEKVKANRMIYLIKNAQQPEQIEFPDLRNSPYRQTMQILKAKGFNIGNIYYSPSAFRNLVLNLQYKGQDMEPGDLLHKGATIDIILGNGNNARNMIPTPSVKGLKLNQAINTLKENYLNIKEVKDDGTITSNLERITSIVYQQSPDPEISPRVEAGSFVTIYITQDREKIQALDSLMVIY